MLEDHENGLTGQIMPWFSQSTKPTTVPTSHEIQDTNLNTLSGLG